MATIPIALQLIFAYHNHDFEFVPSDGAYLLDRLLDATDPDLVALELDVFWATYAGVDPAG
jgi:sugar phosphate isomerase/epimerase